MFPVRPKGPIGNTKTRSTRNRIGLTENLRPIENNSGLFKTKFSLWKLFLAYSKNKTIIKVDDLSKQGPFRKKDRTFKIKIDDIKRDFSLPYWPEMLKFEGETLPGSRWISGILPK